MRSAVIVLMLAVIIYTPVQAVEEGREIVIIGTAHVFDIGEKIENRIIELQPDAVAVELDADRLNTLMRSSDIQPGELVIGEVREPEKVELNESETQILIVMSELQSRMASSFQAQSGEDMLAGMEAAAVLGVPAYPVDKHITTTMEGTLGGLLAPFGNLAETSLRDSVLMLARFIESLAKIGLGLVSVSMARPSIALRFILGSVTDALVGLLLHPSIYGVFFVLLSLPLTMLTTLAIGSEIGIEGMREIYSLMPGIYSSMLTDREAYMADRISEIPGDRIVVVTGAAHLTGLAREVERREPGARVEAMTFLDLF